MSNDDFQLVNWSSHQYVKHEASSSLNDPFVTSTLNHHHALILIAENFEILIPSKNLEKNEESWENYKN